MRILVVTPPAAVLTLEEVKAHLRVRQDSEDALLATYMAAVTKHLDGPDGWLGRALGPQTLEIQQSLTCNPVRLPLPPLISITSIKYLDADGVEQTADADDFYLYGPEANELTAIDAAPWSGGSTRQDALRIRYQAGYVADPTADPLVLALPEGLKLGMLQWIMDAYDHRGTVAFGAEPQLIPTSAAAERLLMPYRLWA